MIESKGTKALLTAFDRLFQRAAEQRVLERLVSQADERYGGN